MNIENIPTNNKNNFREEKDKVDGRFESSKITDKDSENKEDINTDTDNKRLMSRRNFLKGIGAVAASSFVAGTFVGKSLRESNNKNVEVKEEEILEKEGEQEKENNIENLADHYLKAYYELSKDSEKFPGDVFETDLIIAQQCQESRGQIDAKSHSGALGVMQNMTISMKDVTRYLNILMRRTDFKWEGPKELSGKQIARIKKLIIQKSDYSRAFGKIYLMQLWDNKHGYGIGRDYYKKGDIKSTQIALMGAYNAGHSLVKGKSFETWKKLRDKYKNIHTRRAQRKYRAYKEAIDYVIKIMNYKERLGNIREMIDKMGLKLDISRENFLVREIALKLDGIHGVSGEARKRKLEIETKKYLEKIKNFIESKNRLPSHKEIKILV